MCTEDMTINELIAEYNRHGPVNPLEGWEGNKEKLVAMVRVARKQSTPDGVMVSVTVETPD